MPGDDAERKLLQLIDLLSRQIEATALWSGKEDTGTWLCLRFPIKVA